MVGDYLWFAGWRDVEIVTLSEGGKGRGWFGFGGGGDPLWVVRGVNRGVVGDGEGQGQGGAR